MDGLWTAPHSHHATLQALCWGHAALSCGQGRGWRQRGIELLVEQSGLHQLRRHIVDGLIRKSQAVLHRATEERWRLLDSYGFRFAVGISLGVRSFELEFCG